MKITEARIRDEWGLYDNGRFGHLEGVIDFVEELCQERDRIAREEEREYALAMAKKYFEDMPQSPTSYLRLKSALTTPLEDPN